MTQFVDNELPEGWRHIVTSFLEAVDNNVQLNNGVPIMDVTAGVRHNVLSITYSGGDRATDHYAVFAKVMSTNTCTECGLPATIRIFESPKCDDCF